MAEAIVRGRVEYAEGGGPDLHCYRVNCYKIGRTLPEFRPQWTVRRGIEQFYAAYKEHALIVEELLTGWRYIRIKHLSSLLATARLDPTLRWLR